MHAQSGAGGDARDGEHRTARSLSPKALFPRAATEGKDSRPRWSGEVPRQTVHTCGAGSTVTVRLSQRTGNVSSAIASIVVNVAGYFDVTQSVAAGGFLASASDNSLAIEMIEQGQGICTVTALIVDLS
jgi:hypothetical protein